MSRVVLIAHNLRSLHNVGSLLRTAEGLGVAKVYLSGHTPYPLAEDDGRLPYVAARASRQIHKTALGAEMLVSWQHEEDVFALIKRLKHQGYQVVALEQAATSLPLVQMKPHDKVVVIVGREVVGIEPAVLEKTDLIVEIPMLGQKESFNVVQAAAMALYHIRCLSDDSAYAMIGE